MVSYEVLKSENKALRQTLDEAMQNSIELRVGTLLLQEQVNALLLEKFNLIAETAVLKDRVRQLSGNNE